MLLLSPRCLKPRVSVRLGLSENWEPGFGRASLGVSPLCRLSAGYQPVEVGEGSRAAEAQKAETTSEKARRRQLRGWRGGRPRKNIQGQDLDTYRRANR